MVATFWLLSWALAPAQTTPSPRPASPPAAVRVGDTVLTPKLVRGQELVYRGTFTEEATGSRVQFSRGYRFETRYYVLETPPKGVDLAVLTVLHNKVRTGNKADAGPASVRLERLAMDLDGKLRADTGMSLLAPLDATPTLEVGAFVEPPKTRKGYADGWDVAEKGRPAVRWRVVGNESINGQSCVKVVGTQQSDDWDRPRADRSAWKRTETVWVGSRSGVAQAVERVVEHREPARKEISQRNVLRYDLESGLQFPAQLANDRRQEITQAFGFRDAAKPMLGEPTKFPKPLQMLQRKIVYHLENTPPTPYREAVVQVKRQVDLACKGEVVTVGYQEPPARAVPVAAVGDAAPDFVAGPIAAKDAAKLGKLKGKPVLLVFYHPASFTSADLLRFAQQVQAAHGRQVHVLGLSVVDDAATVTKQRDEMKLEFPIYSGGGMRISYGVDATPKVVLIDPAGVIRGMYQGWGSETGREVMGDLQPWLPGR